MEFLFLELYEMVKSHQCKNSHFSMSFYYYAMLAALSFSIPVRRVAGAGIGLRSESRIRREFPK